MENQDVVGIILAAGQGKRMKTTRPKVAHTLLGRPLIEWSMIHFVEAGVADLSVVVSPSQPDVHAIVEQFALKVASRCRVRHHRKGAQKASRRPGGTTAQKRLLQPNVESVRDSQKTEPQRQD